MRTVKAANSPAAAARRKTAHAQPTHRRRRATGASGGGGVTGWGTRSPTAPGTLSSSVLTVFLLVVLGGGAGLLTVWSVHPGSRPRLAGRPGGRSLRATTAAHT